MKSGVTLQQMLTEVKRQSESKEDYLIAPNRLRMESYGKEMFLHLSDDSGTELIEPMTIRHARLVRIHWPLHIYKIQISLSLLLLQAAVLKSHVFEPNCSCSL